MAEFGISIAEKLMEAIGSEMIKEICDLWGYKSQLEELKDNVSTIKKVLLDVAEAKRELSNEEQDFTEKLKDAVYDADDLFDELHTLAELQQLKPLSKRGKFFEKVRCFFSSKNQTLLLRCCKSLSALPKDFCQLVKLRHLDLSGCDKLICMPSGMDKLTSLKVLPNFVVGGENSTVHSDHDELKALKCLTEIRGELSIKIGEHYRRSEGMIARSGGYLKSMKHLTRVGISFENKPGRCVDHDEAAMEALEPPSNMKRLAIYNYKGTTIPRWGRAEDNWAVSLFRLVDISLQGVDDHRQSFGFPFLRQLTIGRCPNLTTFPACPSLEELELYDNKMLWSSFPQNLRILKFKYLSNMTSLPEEIQSLSSLRSLELFRCDRIKALPEWISCLSSLQSLSIYRCLALKSLPEAMRNLTTLQRLYIGRCRDLEERCKKPNGEDYPKVQHIPSISLSIDGRY
ncbi:hypothetical protein BVRB_3g055750 [Beta vulgaris subsp. vulgaris]|uniref:Uncharacterized protein n=1 Tax=Beta vulgaris subsp. vulgaris TaxID=3555 RepID=A0A0J8CQM6_BETVV|nr:hypothetical protein BVRB_3g055750 [Beta vulgaris subsp. vulgaris]